MWPDVETRGKRERTRRREPVARDAAEISVAFEQGSSVSQIAARTTSREYAIPIDVRAGCTHVIGADGYRAARITTRGTAAAGAVDDGVVNVETAAKMGENVLRNNAPFVRLERWRRRQLARCWVHRRVK
jgi:hypothetical protein